jgi:transcriptional regulator GlxA family with amidase domain
VSLRQLELQFKTQVGMSASRFIRIARFQRAIRLKLVSPSLGLATLAAECGYYDQSHFSREFKELSGLSPGRYFGDEHEMADLFAQ